MDRRRFLHDVLLWSAGVSIAVPCCRSAKVFAGQPSSPLVAVAKGADYEKLVGDLLSSFGGMGTFVRPGDMVVVKPNIGWDRTPEEGANTHPLVVRAIAAHCLEAGAAMVRIFDRTCNEKRRCYINSGISDTVESMKNRKVRLEHIDERKFVPVDIEKGKSLTRYDIYRDALEADVYINVPVAKHHGISRLTLGLKNSMGVIGGNRGRLHHDLDQSLADLATVIRPRLTIVDATRMLLRNGPQGGRLSDVKIADTLVASTDPVAADAYATTLFGLQPEEIGSTVAAHNMGLGEIDIARMRFVETVQG